jgi:predicted phosphodiesterase
MRFIVINDIHANYEVLKKFKAVLLNERFDKIIVLGDVLTYGVDVNQTIGFLLDINSMYDCVFIKGNHDQIYFDIQKGLEYQYKPFPNYINESVLYTASKLNFNLEAVFDWTESFVYKKVGFFHANLFDYGDWSYLNDENDFLANYKKLIEKKLRGAVFGHTHRSKYQLFDCGSKVTELSAFDGDICIDEDVSFLLTNGSLGQPRGSRSSYLICEFNNEKCDFKSKIIDYDVAKQCNSIQNSCLSVTTKKKLISFYK